MYTKTNPLSQELKEELATKIKDFLIKKELWIDTIIYVNNKSISTYDSKKHKYYYNDPLHIIVKENENPLDYFEYANPDTISMSFEGPLYEIMNIFDDSPILVEFNELLKEYGLYYELGNSWNLSCYYIHQ